MTKTYYDKISKGYDRLHGEEQRNKLKIIKENLQKNKIKINKNTKLLDVGCGTGLSSDFKCKVVGIDPSIELLKIAKHNYKGDKSKSFIKAFAEKLPFEDKSFDIVISMTAIHNFSNIEKGIKEKKRVGKKVFVISVLKKSKKLPKIDKLIKKYFKIKHRIEEDKDVIYFL